MYQLLDKTLILGLDLVIQVFCLSTTYGPDRVTWYLDKYNCPCILKITHFQNLMLNVRFG